MQGDGQQEEADFIAQQQAEAEAEGEAMAEEAELMATINNEVEKEPLTYEQDKCPCCNKRMYKLASGQWTHLPSLKLKEIEGK